MSLRLEIEIKLEIINDFKPRSMSSHCDTQSNMLYVHKKDALPKRAFLECITRTEHMNLYIDEMNVGLYMNKYCFT